jgi:2',3'-cyclic-nucleotide 2'-phosphodiesterase (5'-nucleotidase family)
MGTKMRLLNWAIALLVACATPAVATELVILHTNDTHSNLFPFGPQKEFGGIARMSTLIKQLRTQNKNVLALHAGDVFVGTFAFNEYLGYPELKMMEGLYDAMALGNHEFDLGADALAAILAGVNPLTAQRMGSPVALPLLSANLMLDEVPALTPFVRSSIIKDIGDLKVGLLGVTTENPLYYAPSLAGVFSDPYAAAGVAAATLRAQGCQVVIAISHLGKAFDLMGLAQVPGIDVIVGGHSHDLLVTEAFGKIIVQAGEFGEYLGELRLDVQNGAVTEKSHVFHAVDREIREDPALLPSPRSTSRPRGGTSRRLG